MQRATTTATHMTLSAVAGWPASIVPKPALHGSGLDELVCLALPMVLLGVVFLFVTRVRPPSEDEDEAQAGAVEASIPEPLAQAGDEQPESSVKISR